jgi:class 3 adenylate cyclase
MKSVGTIAQRLMLRIQETIYQWEGSVNKLVVDDKGLLVLCAFGLPPLRHGDDAYRAVRAALDLPDAIKRVKGDSEVRIGVSTGSAFCGIVGKWH